MVENINLFIVKENKLSCPDHCTVPSGFELWLLLLACFVLIKDEQVSSPWSIYSVSGLQGDQVGALEKWWCGLFFFFSEKLKSSVPGSGSQWFWDQLTQRMNSEQSELVAIKDVSMLSEAYESHHFCLLQTWSDGVAVAGPWACLLGVCEMLMSDGSWVNASVKTSGLWCCMEKQPRNIWVGSWSVSHEHMGHCFCLLRFFPSICLYLLIESQMTDVMIKFLRE